MTDSGAADAGTAEDVEVTEIADPTYDAHADSGGEGEGTGPDPGPDDAEHMSERDGEENSRGS